MSATTLAKVATIRLNMITQQLLDYIRQNLATGVARADIEKALLAAGWSVQDISGGFTMIEHPEAVMPPPPVVPVSAPQVSMQVASVNDDAAETDRIRHEVELEVKRQKWRGATTNTPVVGGIIGWLIAKKIVEEESQANIALIGVAVISIVLAAGIFIWSSGSSGRQQENIPLGLPQPHPASNQ